jgi:hypothetical protein
MHFSTKNTLKNNYNHTLKQIFRFLAEEKTTVSLIFLFQVKRIYNAKKQYKTP